MQDHDAENSATFVQIANGGLRIDVSEERAMDSYNETFTYCVSLTPDQVIDLRDYLIRIYGPYAYRSD